MTPKEFVRRLSEIKTKNSFNPYSDVCSIHDVRGADKLRMTLLLEVLNKASKEGVDAIWIGRDLGYRGGRRTGLALTDEVHADAYAKRWNLTAAKTTRGEPFKERTATVIWDALECIQDNVFLWNVFPLHPHDEGAPFTNRTHNSLERQIGEAILGELIALVRPRRLIAVGNDAVGSIARVAVEIPSIKVRHPSYGGQTEFTKKICELYGIKIPSLQGELF